MTTVKSDLEARIRAYDEWEIRRQYGADGPNKRRLWVLACMDERLPVDEALGIQADTPVGGGDAHLFRSAGGIVTDDAIRSAMLTINFFGTREIIVLQHTGCGMLSANGSDLEKAFRAKGIDNVVPIVIPPLRDRREDLAELVDLILRRLGTKYRQRRKVLGKQAWSKIMRHAWPGTVRELENFLERAFLFARGSCIEDIDAPVPGADPATGAGKNMDLRTQTRHAAQAAETQSLMDALLRRGGNVSAVAREAGITARAVHQKLRAHNIDPAP